MLSEPDQGMLHQIIRRHGSNAREHNKGYQLECDRIAGKIFENKGQSRNVKQVNSIGVFCNLACRSRDQSLLNWLELGNGKTQKKANGSIDRNIIGILQ